MRWNAANRIAFASLLVGSVFTVYSARLIYLGVAQHDEYSSLAAQKNSIRQTIHAKRGLIFDRNGEVLAENSPIRTAVADGSHIEDPAALAQVCAPFLEIDAAELTEKFTTERKYVVIRRGVPAETAFQLQQALQDAGMRGLYFENDSKRVYPNGSMLAHVVGFLDHERQGIQGVELSMNKFLTGQDGFRHIERDRTGREIVVYRGLERAPRDGMNVHLTIDLGLQSIVEEELDASFEELKPDHITVVLVEPKTGEVLAMANRPHFDPDMIAEAEPEQMKNHAVISMVEPGSTFKIVAAAGALNEGIINTAERIHCEGGSFHYGGKVLRDHHPYGLMTVHDILQKSSNIGSAKLAMRMGGDLFYEYVKRFGFGERSGIELPGEIAGMVHPPSRWDNLTITRMPMGHAIAVTPLQMVMAMSVIANGGNLMAPRLVKKLTDNQGSMIKTFEPTVVREVCNPETAHIVNQALASVVGPGGTARLAQVGTFSVAGKTGTAQKVDPNGGYTENQYVVSFVGYLPVEDPEFVAIVLVDDAQISSNLNYGGLVAAPIFARISERAVRHLDIQPILRAEPVAQSASAAAQTVSRR